MSLCVAHRSIWLPLLVCFPAPVCVAASQQDAGDRAAGQSQQPWPQHLQWLWWWWPWARGNLWPSQVLVFKTPLSLQTGQQSGDHVLAGSRFLPFTSCPSLSSFAHWILLHQPLFTLLNLSPSCPRHMWLIFLLFVLPLLPLFFSALSFLPSLNFTHLFSFLLFPSAQLLPLSSSLPPCSTSPFSLPFYSHSSSLPFFLPSSCLHPPSSTSSSV